MFATLRSRELACRGRSRHDRAIQQALLKDLTCDEEHDRHEIGEHVPPYSNGIPPFSVAFCPYAGQENWAAVADEEGTVTLLDTNRSAIEQPGARRRAAIPRPPCPQCVHQLSSLALCRQSTCVLDRGKRTQMHCLT